ncbi:MAG: hypothetical protein JST45_06945 [Bacteroidetes bacterium]|nr:hypothetical protein [Bacteroidota bacterium]
MSEQALLMPAKEEGEAFNLDAHLASLKQQPKEVYEEAITPPSTEPEPKAEPKPEPEPEPKAKADSTADDGASARFIVHMYDIGTSKLCEALVDEPERYPAKHFQLEPMLREEAERQLAKGMAESGGKWRIPWYWALFAVFAFGGLMQWLAVKAARKEKKERREREAEQADAQARHQAEQARRNPGQAVAPSSITKANGEQVHAAPVPPIAPVSFGSCLECGKPLEKKGKKYCSQSCAGHARKKKAAKNITTP